MMRLGWGTEHVWGETETNIKDFEGSDLLNGDAITLEYQTVVSNKSDNVNDKNIYGEIDIKSTDNTLDNKITTIRNSIQDAELKCILKTIGSEEYKWIERAEEIACIELTNTTNQDLNNIEVQITLSKGLSCNKDNFIECDDNTKINVKSKEFNTELGQTIIILEIDSINQGKSAVIRVNPDIEEFEGENSYVEFSAIASTESKKIYTSNNVKRKVYSGAEKSNLRIDKSITVNEKAIDENTILENGDKISINVSLENLKDKEVRTSTSILLDNCIKDIKINSIQNGNKQDISNKMNNNKLYTDYMIKTNEKIQLTITAVFDNSRVYNENVRNIINIEDITYGKLYSENINVKAQKPDDSKSNLTIKQESNPKDKSVIKNGQKVEFTTSIENTGDYDRKVNIIDSLNNTLKNVRVYMGNEDVTNKYLRNNSLEISECVISPKSKVYLKIEGIINLDGYTKDIIANTVTIKSSYSNLDSNTITYYTSEQNSSEDSSNHKTNNNTNQTKKYTIAGVAWIDSNKNGKRENSEKLIKSLTIKAINTKTGKTMSQTTSTNENGEYKLTLPQGKYTLVFMYDNDKYSLTTYHANNVNEKLNSDAISKKLNIDNKEDTYGVTDEINLTSNKENIDIGLVDRSKFDLKLDKYISKVVVTNKVGTKTYNFDKSTLAKVEIASKYLSGSTVLIEYTMKATNVGDTQGSVKKIVDNLPSGLNFTSSLNKDWYKSGNKLINDNLESKELNAGESKEVKLILTKKMTHQHLMFFLDFYLRRFQHHEELGNRF
ncbi:MAG: hypothetical protein HFJ17_04375, partial [Clostridia bacterium]|nr:hypothetical protein [Clostridia bacterium]